MVNSRDVELYLAFDRVLREDTIEAFESLEKEIAHRQYYDTLFATLFGDSANAPETPQDFDCLRKMVESVEDSCGRFSSYSLKYVRSLANMCDTQPEKVQETLKKVEEHCTSI